MAMPSLKEYELLQQKISCLEMEKHYLEIALHEGPVMECRKILRAPADGSRIQDHVQKCMEERNAMAYELMRVRSLLRMSADANIYDRVIEIMRNAEKLKEKVDELQKLNSEMNEEAYQERKKEKRSFIEALVNDSFEWHTEGSHIMRGDEYIGAAEDAHHAADILVSFAEQYYKIKHERDALLFERAKQHAGSTP